MKKLLVYLIFLLSFLTSLSFNTTNIGLYIQFLVDVLIIVLVCYCTVDIFSGKVKLNITLSDVLIFIMFFLSVITLIINKYSLINYLWGFRNFHIYLLYLLCIKHCDIKFNIKKMLMFCFCFSIIQIPIILVQYKLGFKFDNISGLYGPSGTGLLMINTIAVIYMLSILYNYKEVKLKTLIVVFLLYVLIAAIAEIKIMFYFIPLIIILYLVFCFNKKTVGVLLFLCIFFIGGISLYSSLYPKIAPKGLFSMDFINSYAINGSYDNTKTINRISGIGVVYNEILKDKGNQLIGLGFQGTNKCNPFLGVGLGNAAPNKSNILEGKYNLKYGYYNYNYFFIPYFLLENGLINTILFFLMLLVSVFRFIKIMGSKRSKQDNILLKFACGYIIIVIVSTLYNSDLYNMIITIPFFTILGFCGKIKTSDDGSFAYFKEELH